MFAQWADEIIRQCVSLINIAADLAHKPLLPFCLGLWFHIFLIIRVCHGRLIAEHTGLCYTANKHSMRVQIHILFYFEGHHRIDIPIQNDKAVVRPAQFLSGELVHGSSALESEILKDFEWS